MAYTTRTVRATRSRARGFTLLELMITVTLLAIVTAMAVPGLRSFVQNNRATAQANELAMALNLARSEAISRGVAASVCASGNGTTCSGQADWSAGWIVFTDPTPPHGVLNSGPGDDELRRSFPALRGGSELKASRPAVTYQPNGFLNANEPVTFELRMPGCVGPNGRDIQINLQGRAAVQRVDC